MNIAGPWVSIQQHLLLVEDNDADAELLIAASYELTAKSFVTKPKDLADYESLIKRILYVDLNGNGEKH